MTKVIEILYNSKHKSISKIFSITEWEDNTEINKATSHTGGFFPFKGGASIPTPNKKVRMAETKRKEVRLIP